MATKITATEVKNNNPMTVTLENGVEVEIGYDASNKDYQVLVESEEESIICSTVKEVNAALRDYETAEVEEAKPEPKPAAKADAQPARVAIETFAWWGESYDCNLTPSQDSKLNAVLEHVTTRDSDDEEAVEDMEFTTNEDGTVTVNVTTNKTNYSWRLGKRGGFDSKDGLGRWHDGTAAWDIDLDFKSNGVFCRECNKVLTDPVSVALGIGPECCDKMGIKHVMPKDEDDE